MIYLTFLEDDEVPFNPPRLAPTPSVYFLPGKAMTSKWISSVQHYGKRKDNISG